MSSKFLSLGQVCNQFNISKSIVLRRVKKGVFTPVTIGRRFYFDPAQIQDFLEENDITRRKPRSKLGRPIPKVVMHQDEIDKVSGKIEKANIVKAIPKSDPELEEHIEIKDVDLYNEVLGLTLKDVIMAIFQAKKKQALLAKRDINVDNFFTEMFVNMKV